MFPAKKTVLSYSLFEVNFYFGNKMLCCIFTILSINLIDVDVYNNNISLHIIIITYNAYNSWICKSKQLCGFLYCL